MQYRAPLARGDNTSKSSISGTSFTRAEAIKLPSSVEILGVRQERAKGDNRTCCNAVRHVFRMSNSLQGYSRRVSLFRDGSVQ